jgi:hypothetical protein
MDGVGLYRESLNPGRELVKPVATGPNKQKPAPIFVLTS